MQHSLDIDNVIRKGIDVDEKALKLGNNYVRLRFPKHEKLIIACGNMKNTKESEDLMMQQAVTRKGDEYVTFFISKMHCDSGTVDTCLNEP